VNSRKDKPRLASRQSAADDDEEAAMTEASIARVPNS
jgi:hypothetical protein